MRRPLQSTGSLKEALDIPYCHSFLSFKSSLKSSSDSSVLSRFTSEFFCSSGLCFLTHHEPYLLSLF